MEKKIENGVINMKLTNEEIFILSEGLFALIHNCSEAEKFVPDKQVQKAIKKSMKKYQDLNSKLMVEIDEKLGVVY